MPLRKPHPLRRTRARTSAAVCVGASLAAMLLSAGGAPAQSATSARVVSLDEHGALHLVSKHGFTLNEKGSASGTIKGAISVQLKIVSTSRVTALVTVSPHGGSISGEGTASYHKGSSAASFSGSLSITRGSGTYSHARGSGLSFSGTIARSNDAITVHVSGRLSE